jgi:DNA polymerase (family 10)
MSHNREVAGLLEEFADLLEAQDVEYKPRAYRRAAENVRGHHEPIEALAAEGQDAVESIEGVGDAISSKIAEYFETGEIEELQELRSELPVDMAALTSVEGVGPKTVGTLYEELDVVTLDDLEAAAEAGEIREISGFGPKTEQNILDNVAFAREAHERELLGEARPYGDRIESSLADVDAVDEVALAGSIRRWRPTIGDLDVLAGTDEPEAVVDAFTAWEAADTVIEAGTWKASLRADGFQVDLRVVDTDEFGSALQYFTGSKDHNVTLRNRAIERDLKMNEYGVFDVSDVPDDVDDQRAGERVAGESEAGMYEALDLPWIPPELRADRGEIPAAEAGTLPDLVTVDAVRGDLHTHTEWSDGQNTIREMATGAAEFGHDYLAITDHATGPGMVGGVGLSDAELRDQLAAVRAVDDDVEVDLFTGVEANVGTDGSVSVADDVLADLDVVVASPHAGLDGDGTDRLVTAVEHPHVDILGHPTGRMLNQRSGLDVDVERLAEAAADAGVALEVNSDPRRLDLDGAAVKPAIEAGATIVVDTDAHRPGTFPFVRNGVHTARRGWAEAADVLNTRDADGVRSFLAY